MILFKNDEEKRSKAYRIVTVAAVVVIILIGAFFVRKGFAGDPLEGSWIYAEGDWNFTFDGEERLTISAAEAFDGNEVKILMKYSLDRESKMVTLMADSEKLSEVIEEKAESVDEEKIRTFTEGFEESYDYSVDGNELTLTDAESGNQFVFIKK